VDDVGFASKAGALYLRAQRQRERLAAMTTGPTLNALGLTSMPGA
jgi:hypothetical protein